MNQKELALLELKTLLLCPTCPSCKRLLERQYSLYPTYFLCFYCGKVFKFTRPKKIRLGKYFTCPLCKDSYEIEEILQDLYSEQRIFCPSCRAAFKVKHLWSKEKILVAIERIVAISMLIIGASLFFGGSDTDYNWVDLLGIGLWFGGIGLIGTVEGILKRKHIAKQTFSALFLFYLLLCCKVGYTEENDLPQRYTESLWMQLEKEGHTIKPGPYPEPTGKDFQTLLDMVVQLEISTREGFNKIAEHINGHRASLEGLLTERTALYLRIVEMEKNIRELENQIVALTETDSNEKPSGQQLQEAMERAEKVFGDRRKRLEETKHGIVTRVIDGDTIEVDTLGRVRLLRVDCPEKNQEGFQKATDLVNKLLLGQEVKIEIGKPEKDKYGRWLGEVFFGSEFEINASDYILHYNFCPPYKR